MAYGLGIAGNVPASSLLSDGVDVVADIRPLDNTVGEFAQKGQAADSIKLSSLLQAVCDAQRVNRVSFDVILRYQTENLAMGINGEVV